MHQGRGGMGSHKHRHERSLRKRVRPAMYETVQEAMAAAYADMKAKRT